MSAAVKKTEKRTTKGRVLLHAKWRHIAFIAVPDDTHYRGTKNIVVRDTKMMLLEVGIKTVLKPCVITFEI